MADGDAKTEAMLDRAQFHAMVEGTPEDWQAIATGCWPISPC